MKTLKLKKEVVSILDRNQSSMVKGGAGTTVIQLTEVCGLTKKDCETFGNAGQCVSATGCNTDLCPATDDCQITKDGCMLSQGGTCIVTRCDC